MKKIKIVTTVAITLTFLLSSCEKSIDFGLKTVISGETALNSTVGLETAVIGAYDRLQSGDLYGGHMWTTGDMISYGNKKSGEYALVYEEIQMVNKNMSPDNRITVSMWIQGYWVINQVNTILEAIPEVKDDQIEEAKDQITGECLFLRALIHFDMMRYFENINSGEAIPLLIATTTITDQPSRASMEEVYAQVIDDLTQAADLLPASNNDRATSWAAKALMSRVYFYHEEYEQARDMASEVIDNGPFSLTTDSLLYNYTSVLSNEIIFAVMGRVGDATSGTLNGFYRKVPGSAPKFILSDKLQDLFLFTSGYTTIADERYKQLVMVQEGKAYAVKFNDRFMSVPLIRLAEMYLTRGESRYIMGDISGAREDLNVIRERALIKPFPYLMNNITFDINPTSIYVERQKELFYEGDDFHNKRRLEKTIKDPNPNNDIQFLYNAYELMFKIPQREIDVNPNLTQNGP